MKRYYPLSVVLLALLAPSAALAIAPNSPLSGAVTVDGSSTVYPITEAVAEEFGTIHRGVRVTVGISGTGGGMKKFTVGETDISNASRPIKSTEADIAATNKISFIEIPVAFDALTVVVNPKNTWATSMTVKELKMLWEPAAQGKITKWNQIRSNWPDKEIKLFGPGVDSGTFDYFTEAVVGKEDASRGDFTSSEDDNVLVQGVANDQYALGFFGFAYFEENQKKLKAVAIDDENDANGKGAILPSLAAVEKGEYAPLARPLFVYVSNKSLERPEVAAFMDFYLNKGSELAREVGYLPLPSSVLALAQGRLAKRVAGSVYSGVGHAVGVPLEKLLLKGTSTSAQG